MSGARILSWQHKATVHFFSSLFPWPGLLPLHPHCGVNLDNHGFKAHDTLMLQNTSNPYNTTDLSLQQLLLSEVSSFACKLHEGRGQVCLVLSKYLLDGYSLSAER